MGPCEKKSAATKSAKPGLSVRDDCSMCPLEESLAAAVVPNHAQENDNLVEWSVLCKIDVNLIT